MSEPVPSARTPAEELGRFLEIQNLGLNLPFALAFLLVAAGGVPSWRILTLIVVAFVAARNAGHSFNRWADREQDAENPRTQDRAMVTGRVSPGFALGLAASNGTILLVAAYLLNTLAFVLAPAALALIFGYSYTKRFTSFTTVFLGLVEAITPAAVFIAVTGTLPVPALVAVVAMLLWGTAFETVHSLGDVESDRALRLYSIPVRIGVGRSLLLIPLLHSAALLAFLGFGLLEHFGSVYDGAILLMAVLAALTDRELARSPRAAQKPFRRHFALGAIFFAGVLLSVFPALI